MTPKELIKRARELTTEEALLPGPAREVLGKMHNLGSMVAQLADALEAVLKRIDELETER